ncbi:unnamed protein product [Closterium sp. Yama58-4]|nr:unnamed protein product [Closterium sp. Yama58-4]
MAFPVTRSLSRSLVAWAAFVVLIGTFECAGSHATRLLLTEPLAGGVAPINLTAPGLQTTSVHAVNPAANAAVGPEASVAAEAAAEMFGFCLGDEEECSPSLAGSRERVANESSRIDAAVSEGGLSDDANGSTGSSGSSDGSSGGGGGGGGSSEAEVARRASERLMALIAEGRDQLEGERLEEAVATYDEVRGDLAVDGGGAGVVGAGASQEGVRAVQLLRRFNICASVSPPSQAVNANPNNAELWMEVGAERETLGQHERAHEAFSRVLELLPGDAEALKRRGLSAFNLYRFKDALKDLLPVLHMLPDDADLNRAVVRPLLCSIPHYPHRFSQLPSLLPPRYTHAPFPSSPPPIPHFFLLPAPPLFPLFPHFSPFRPYPVSTPMNCIDAGLKAFPGDLEQVSPTTHRSPFRPSVPSPRSLTRGVLPMADAGLKAFPGDLEIMHVKASSLHVLGEHAAAVSHS